MADRNPKASQCSARSKTSGKQCSQPAIPGGAVCRYHGGSAPQVVAAARLRLLMAADAAAATLVQIFKDKKMPPNVRLAAANSTLDRNNIKGDADLMEARTLAVKATIEANRTDQGDTQITSIELVLVHPDGTREQQ